MSDRFSQSAETTPPDASGEYPSGGMEAATHATSFNEEVDAVVAGFGFAGGIAFLGAAKAGASVVLLEAKAVPDSSS